MAHFAEVMRPLPRPLLDEQTQVLGTIVARRRPLIEMLTAEKNRVSRAPQPIRARLRVHIAWLEQEVARTETDLAQAIRNSPVWRENRGSLAEHAQSGACAGDHAARRSP